jgi:hypothetical protein
VQRNFKPSPERLSVAECSNRIALTEEFVFRFVTDQELRASDSRKAKGFSYLDDGTRCSSS